MLIARWPFLRLRLFDRKKVKKTKRDGADGQLVGATRRAGQPFFAIECNE